MIHQDLSSKNDVWRQPQVLTALIVDVHSFGAMCSDPRAEGVARFMRDVLAGAVNVTERSGGLVANTMGDGVLCLFETADAAFTSACEIVRDFGNQNEYLLAHQTEFQAEPYVSKGLRCRCALESGPIEHHPLRTNTGTFTLWVGNAINYAARILDAEERASGPNDQIFNTIVLGPTSFV
jgi:class 3 adenylate cyclase